MNLKQAISFVTFCAVTGAVSAQNGFTHLDWNKLRIDSTLKYYKEVIPLSGDYRGVQYKVRLDYPEYQPLTDAETVLLKRLVDSLPEHPVINSRVEVSRKQGMLDVSFLPIVYRDGKYQKLLSFRMMIERNADRALSMSALQSNLNISERYASNSVLSEGKWVKIGVSSEGIYRLTSSDLKRMGFNDPSKVKLYGYGGNVQDEVINPDTDYDDLEEVPLYRTDKGLLFYARGLVSWTKPQYRSSTQNYVMTHRSNPYSTVSCYFLTEGDNPLPFTKVKESVSSSAELLSAVPASSLYKKEEYSWYETGRTFYESEAFNYSKTSKSYKIPVSNPVENSKASLKVYFSAAATTETTVNTTIDGSAQSSFRMSVLPSDGYTAATTYTKTYNIQSLNKDADNIDVSFNVQTTGEARLGYIELNYMRNLVMSEPYIYMRHGKNSEAKWVINTNGRNVSLWKLGMRGEPVTEIEGEKSGNTLTVGVEDCGLEYVAVDVDADYPSPQFIENINNQNLHASEPADMVIIVPKSGKLNAQAERLADAHRRIDGMSVLVVEADKIYNEFSSGTPDATAYRRFMKMLYDRAATDEEAPRYLLLFGDGIWDNRLVTTSTSRLSVTQDDLLLCYEAENSLSHTQSYVMEDYYGLLDDGEGNSLLTNKVDIGIGRFPVVTEEQASIMVDKTIDYMENKYAGSWRNTVCIMGDDGDNNNHLEMAEDIASLVEDKYPDMEVKRIFWDAYKRESSASSNTYPGAENDIKKQMEEGALMMNYTGHGNPRQLSHELVMEIDDFVSFSSPNVPLWVTAACDIAPFDMLKDNIGETAVLRKEGSALAFYGTTRTVYANENSYMNQYFTEYVLQRDYTGRQNTIGDAVRLSKVNLLDSSDKVTDYTANKLHYVLLGDPALRLARPENVLSIDSINGIKIEEGVDMPQFKAGSMAVISGHVQNLEGNPITNFSGVLTAKIYDSKGTVTCLNNDGQSDENFVFETRDKLLYSGNDSVKSGEFSISFPIPLDIKYSDLPGRISLYAISNDRSMEANGYSEDVIVGGSGDDLQNDVLGPKITAWLNREDFVNGATVNSKPYFFAQLEDESGINVSDNSVGHNIELIIDNNPATTYVLNDYYTAEFGNYRKGSLGFSIPALPDGHHSLEFRVWDVMNNYSTYEMDFNVSSSLSPELVSVYATNNPAKEQTTFMVCYDRPGTDCSFTLEVFDFAGRLLWNHTETAQTDNGVYPVTWNLTTSSGKPLSTGVYLYRVTLSDAESKAVSKTNKIIVLHNK